MAIPLRLNGGEDMMATDYKTNSIGTKDWLKATAQLTIRAYTEDDETPHAQDTEVLALEDFVDALERASRPTGPSTPTVASSGT